MCKHFLTATQAGVRFTVRHEASGESQEGRGREEDGRRWTGRERDRVEGREGEGRRKEGEGRERKRCKEMDREERDRERGGREGERGRERRRGLRDGRETKQKAGWAGDRVLKALTGTPCFWAKSFWWNGISDFRSRCLGAEDTSTSALWYS